MVTSLNCTSFYFKVSPEHELYVESENEPGAKWEGKIPLLVLHGGPGAPLDIKDYRILFPKNAFGNYALVTFHQRGCGRSKAYKGKLYKNKSKYIVDDIHALKQYLAIKAWCVFGASWGATLAVLYSANYPKDILSLHIHGLSLFDGCIEDSSKAICYDYYREFVNFAKSVKKDDCSVLQWYHSQIKKGNVDAIDRWCAFEDKCMLSFPKITSEKFEMTDEQKQDISLLESYYYVNKAFTNVLDQIKKMSRVAFPIYITHGRFDAVCSLSNALRFKRIIPSTLLMITNHGHSSFNVENANAIRDGLNKFLGL